MRVLTAGIYQFDIRQGAVDTNVQSALEGISRLSDQGVDLAVLPEMFSSSFDYPALSEHAQKTPGIIEILAKTAADKSVVIAGSLPEAHAGGIYNTLYVIDKNGEMAGRYRKTHLFSLIAEDKNLEPGRTAVVCDTSGGRLGLMICYDLRFAEMGVHLAAGGARMIVLCAQWPAVRIDHWDALLMARAIENQVFVVAANRCGADSDSGFNGHSRIIAPDGAILADAGQVPAHVSAELDFSVIDNLRTRFCPVAQRVPAAYPPA